VARVPVIGGPLRFILWYVTTIYFGCDIAPGATFGPGLYLPHPTGIVIGEEWDVGANVRILHGVTLGRTTKSTRRCSVGDNVGIGAGAKIIGSLDIGTGARVGANAVVTKSVPPGATAVGIPAWIPAVSDKEGDADVAEN
jgi:serine O-acetyltransferase